MLTNPHQTTTLTDIRDFLAAQAAAVAPWEQPQQAVDRLYALLEERKGDRRFWSELRTLAERLEDKRFDAGAMRSSTVLSSATVGTLIEDLRASMGQSGLRAKSLREWLAGSLSATALAGFLLLGTAAATTGCDDDSDGTGDIGQGLDGSCDEAAEQELTGDAAGVYCELVDIVQEADLYLMDRQALLTCLPDLDAGYRARLLRKFQSMSDEELADYLTGMVGDTCPSAEDAH